MVVVPAEIWRSYIYWVWMNSESHNFEYCNKVCRVAHSEQFPVECNFSFLTNTVGTFKNCYSQIENSWEFVKIQAFFNFQVSSIPLNEQHQSQQYHIVWAAWYKCDSGAIVIKGRKFIRGNDLVGTWNMIQCSIKMLENSPELHLPGDLKHWLSELVCIVLARRNKFPVWMNSCVFREHLYKMIVLLF